MRNSKILHKEHTLEKNLDRIVVQWLKKSNHQYLKQPRGFNPGIPDIQVLLGNGKHIWIELKSATGTLSRQQTLRIDQLRKIGDKVVVCKTLNEVIEAIKS